MNDVIISSFANVIDENGILWISESNFNSLFAYNISAQTMRLYGQFPEVSALKKELHISAFSVNDEIIFTPMKHNKIGIYNKKNERFFEIEVPCEKKEVLFGEAVLVNNCIYFVSDDGIMICYEIDKHFAYKSEMSDLIQNFVKKGDGIIGRTTFSNGIIITNRNSKAACIIDLIKKDIEYLNIPDVGSIPLDLYLNNEELWIEVEEHQDLFCWNHNTGEVDKYEALQDEWIENRRSVPYSPIFFDDIVIIPNYYANEINYIDKKKKSICSYGRMPSSFSIRKEFRYGPTYYKVNKWLNEYYLVPYRGNMLLRISLTDKEVKGLKLEFPIDKFDSTKMMKESIDENLVIFEDNNIFNFDAFIKSLKGV